MDYRVRDPNREYSPAGYWLCPNIPKIREHISRSRVCVSQREMRYTRRNERLENIKGEYLDFCEENEKKRGWKRNARVWNRK